ncbi:MAG: hypothetical protein ABJA35_08150, partial [Parafilimonas sp.]
MNYIHNNPVNDKWKSASLPEDYFHSSGAFYVLNKEHQFVRLTHWKMSEVSTHRPLEARLLWKKQIIFL